MKRAAALFPLALAACTTTAPMPGDALLFSGSDRNVQIRIYERRVTFRERVGRDHWTYEDLAPSSEPITGGLRYRGILRREFAIAGLAEEQAFAYTLAIRAAGCSAGAPATLTLRGEGDEETATVWTVCGRAPSR